MTQKKWGKTRGNEFYFELTGSSNYPSSNYRDSTVISYLYYLPFNALCFSVLTGNLYKFPSRKNKSFNSRKLVSDFNCLKLWVTFQRILQRFLGHSDL